MVGNQWLADRSEQAWDWLVCLSDPLIPVDTRLTAEAQLLRAVRDDLAWSSSLFGGLIWRLGEQLAKVSGDALTAVGADQLIAALGPLVTGVHAGRLSLPPGPDGGAWLLPTTAKPGSVSVGDCAPAQSLNDGPWANRLFVDAFPVSTWLVLAASIPGPDGTVALSRELAAAPHGSTRRAPTAVSNATPSKAAHWNAVMPDGEWPAGESSSTTVRALLVTWRFGQITARQQGATGTLRGPGAAQMTNAAGDAVRWLLAQHRRVSENCLITADELRFHLDTVSPASLAASGLFEDAEFRFGNWPDSLG